MAIPIAMPTATSSQPAPDDHPKHIRAFRPKRHAYADLMRLLRRRVRQHAVDAHRHENQADASEHRHQQKPEPRPCIHPLVGEILQSAGAHQRNP